MVDNTLENRVRRAWVAPLVSTVLTLPLGFFALVFGGLSPMACDSCDSAQSKRFDRSFEPAFTVLQVGIAVSVVLLTVGWCLTGSDRYAGLRRLCVLLTPFTVLVAWAVFESLVDWPG
jgi:hypothetical protein